MKLIQLPFPQNSKGTYTKNLHFILFFFKLRLNNSDVNHLFDDKGFSSGYSKEVFNQQFGKSTTKLVAAFQDVLNIKKRTDNVIDELVFFQSFVF